MNIPMGRVQGVGGDLRFSDSVDKRSDFESGRHGLLLQEPPSFYLLDRHHPQTPNLRWNTITCSWVGVVGLDIVSKLLQLRQRSLRLLALNTPNAPAKGGGAKVALADEDLAACTRPRQLSGEIKQT